MTEEMRKIQDQMILRPRNERVMGRGVPSGIIDAWIHKHRPDPRRLRRAGWWLQKQVRIDDKGKGAFELANMENLRELVDLGGSKTDVTGIGKAE